MELWENAAGWGWGVEVGKEGVEGVWLRKRWTGTPMSRGLKAQRLQHEEEEKGRPGTEASLGPAPEWREAAQPRPPPSAGSTLPADVACKGRAHNLWPLPMPFPAPRVSLPSSVGGRAGFEKRPLDLRVHCPATQK